MEHWHERLLGHVAAWYRGIRKHEKTDTKMKILFFLFTDCFLIICKEKPKMQFYLNKMILFRKPTPRTADSGCLVVVSRETKMVILDGRSVFF